MFQLNSLLTRFALATTLLVTVVAFTIVTNPVPKEAFADSPNTGSIWTTNLGCGGQQDVNQYSVGESVAIHGKNFDPNDVINWKITGQPGDASCNPGGIVASGTATADSQGNFCISPAYTIASGNCGEYTVDVSDPAHSKNDNYRVDGVIGVTPTPSPSASPSPSVSPSISPSPSASASASPSPSVSPSASPSASPLSLPTVTPSPSAVPSPSIYDGPLISPSPVPTPSTDPASSPTPSPSASPALTPSPTPNATPTPGNSSSLGKDGPTCSNGTFEATMDVRDGNNNPVPGVAVTFTYRGDIRQTTTNSNGRAATVYSFSGNDSVYASANGFPSQALYVSGAQNCPPGVGGTSSSSNGSVLGTSTNPDPSHGSVLGASTLAFTGTDYLTPLYYGAAFAFLIAGGSGMIVLRRESK